MNSSVCQKYYVDTNCSTHWLEIPWFYNTYTFYQIFTVILFMSLFYLILMMLMFMKVNSEKLFSVVGIGNIFMLIALTLRILTIIFFFSIPSRYRFIIVNLPSFFLFISYILFLLFWLDLMYDSGVSNKKLKTQNKFVLISICLTFVLLIFVCLIIMMFVNFNVGLYFFFCLFYGSKIIIIVAISLILYKNSRRETTCKK